MVGNVRKRFGGRVCPKLCHFWRLADQLFQLVEEGFDVAYTALDTAGAVPVFVEVGAEGAGQLEESVDVFVAGLRRVYV